MNYLNNKIHVKKKEKRFILHPTENKFLRQRKKLKPLTTQFQVGNDTKTRRNQNFVKIEIEEL